MTKEEAEKEREVEEEMDLRRGEWRSMRGLFKLNTIPPFVDTFKVSLLETTCMKISRTKLKYYYLRRVTAAETTWLKASSSTCTCCFFVILLLTGSN